MNQQDGHIDTPPPTLVELALQKVGQALCRHTFLIVNQKDRKFLRCSTCGRETVGFRIGPAEGAPRPNA